MSFSINSLLVGLSLVLLISTFYFRHKEEINYKKREKFIRESFKEFPSLQHILLIQEEYTHRVYMKGLSTDLVVLSLAVNLYLHLM